MIIKTKEFQDCCKKILEAVDTTTKQVLDETLELKTENNRLFLNVTNGEYYVSIMFKDEVTESLHATVDAKVFLALVSKITTETLELKLTDNSICVVANGTYKFPFICDTNNAMYEPKNITINNETNKFTINSDILLSILNYNSKELTKGFISRPVQKMFYVDEQGCITFTTGACVNSFTLPSPIKLLLNSKLVKLFKLFNDSTDVSFTIGLDEDSSGFIQTKVRFENDTIKLTAILDNDNNMLASVPVSAIRGRANNTYKYSVNISKSKLIEAIDRLSLFTSNTSAGTNATFTFGQTSVKIKTNDNIYEVVEYSNTTISEEYTAILNLVNLKTTLDTCDEEFLTIYFGDNQAIVLARKNVKNIIPEMRAI